MPRRTFFSFHYKSDVSRAWVARNSWVTKIETGEREDAGFFDSSVFEAKERESPHILKNFLRDGLRNTTVTCVLVGAETTLRRWVRYEIFQSFIRGNGLLAVRVHSIRDLNNMISARGGNPFDALAFRIDQDRVRFREYLTTGWGDAQDVGSMPLQDVAYDLGRMDHHTFACLFPIFEWDTDDGYKNLGRWIEEAAGLAGR